MLRRRRGRRQPVGREIPQVPGHDHVRPYPDRCRQLSAESPWIVPGHLAETANAIRG